MLSKSLIPFSIDGLGCVPSLLFDLRPNYAGGNENNGTSFKRSHANTDALSALNLTAGYLLPTHTFARDSWTLTGKSRSVSCGVNHCSFLLSPHPHKILFVPSKSLLPSPV